MRNKSYMTINSRMFENKINKDKINLNTQLYNANYEYHYDDIVRFAKEWILSVTGEDYFNNIYVENSHNYKVLRRRKIRSLLKNEDPQMAIIPRYDTSYNRDLIDVYLHGHNTLKMNRYDSAIIRDTKRNSYIGVDTIQIRVEFDVKMKFKTKIQQMNMYNKLKLGLKCGRTQEFYRDDSKFVVPFNVINEMYEGLFGSEIDQTSVESIQEAMEYLNSVSLCPIIYDLNLANNKYLFYLLIDQYRYHITFLDDISVDDGNRSGHINEDFMLDFNFSITAPAPYFYYWLYNDKRNTKILTNVLQGDEIQPKDTLEKTDIPVIELKEFTAPVTLNGWDQYINTVIHEVKSGDLVMNVEDVTLGLGFSKPIIDTIKYCTDRYINSDVFIGIIAIQSGVRLDVECKWIDGTITIKDIPNDGNVDMYIYTDKNYINKTIIEIKANSGRI